MPPPDNGNEYISFARLIALEPISSDVYRSKALAFGPAQGNRTYGGHVYMQACYAAAQTVAKGMVLHNVTGWFLIAGKANERFIYTVRRIRDGGYAARAVDVVQESDPEMCFTCICSFKKPERANAPSLDVGQSLDLKTAFQPALDGKAPLDHEEMPGIDAPWYWDYIRTNNNTTEPFPGLHLRKVNMSAHNAALPPLEKRTLKYYSVIGNMPSVETDPNMHVCAHLYASDRNSVFTISNHLSLGNGYSAIASLSHSVIFHTTAQELSMTAGPRALWFVQEAWTGGCRHGRGLHQSRMWREDGVHVATTMQDGMVRVKGEGEGEGKKGFSPVRVGKL